MRCAWRVLCWQWYISIHSYIPLIYIHTYIHTMLSFPDREVDLQLYRPHAVGELSQETYEDEYYQYIDQVGPHVEYLIGSVVAV